MKIFRSLPTNRLLGALALSVVVAVAGTIAVAASGGGGATPPAKPLAQALHDALGGSQPAGISARIHFTNGLLPSGALTGQTGSALLGSADGRLWAGDKGGRIELQSDGGDVQVTWNDTKATVFDASSNTVYVFDLPASKKSTDHTGAAPTLDEITTFLADAAKHWAISAAEPSNVAGQQAYTVSVSPKENGGLLGSVQAAWDAIHGTPLEIEVYAKGSSTPVLGLKATDISYGAVPTSAIDVTPPASAKVVDLSSAVGHGRRGHGEAKPVVGLQAVTAAAPFPVTAPDTIDGLARSDARLVGPADGRAAVLVYGQGLGSIVVVERKADAKSGGMLAALSTVNLDGRITHELTTPLGTVLGWSWNGVSYVLAGSVTQASAEAAAQAIR